MTVNSPPGSTRVRAEVLSQWPAQAMQALLDRDPAGIGEGDPLPLGWHWLYFKRPVRTSGLGPDGHERRGTFMPEIDLPRRMWAGGTLRSLHPVRIGGRAELRSGIREVEEKRGKSGRLVFVTVEHTLLQDGHACVEEKQVIVYREAGRRPGTSRTAADPPAPAASPGTSPAAAWTETFVPTPVTLFQFSALTYNGHRIHYDQPYATGKEGYRGLLVHGPLTALLLLDAAQRHRGAAVSSFRYRALAPLFVDEPITMVGRPDSEGDVVEALDPAGSVAMRGRVGRGA